MSTTGWRLTQHRLRPLVNCLREGKAIYVLQQLRELLSEIDARNPDNAFACATILRLMAEASSALGEDVEAETYLERATEILRWSIGIPVTEQVVIFLALAENLSCRGKTNEALQFAEIALDCLADSPDEFDPVELRDILRRYADVAISAGQALLAQTAYSLNLLIVQIESGVTSDVSVQLLSFIESSENETSMNAVKRVGQYLREAYYVK